MTRYNRRVRRLMQLVVSLLLLMPLLWPVTEFFDRWDAPGLDNDIEIALFAILFALGLVLLLTHLLSRLEPVRGLVASAVGSTYEVAASCRGFFSALAVVPSVSPPLQI